MPLVLGNKSFNYLDSQECLLYSPACFCNAIISLIDTASSTNSIVWHYLGTYNFDLGM